MSDSTDTPKEDGGLIVKLLSVFAVVHPSEVSSTLLLTLDGILLLASYYFLKVIREPLILAVPHGAEIKSYATGALAILLIGVFYGYRAVAQRVPRVRLITYTKLFCVACLVAFWALDRAGAPIGIAFYLWVGCYSLTILAQLWAFANDIYTQEQGKRVFAIIGLGSSAGALLGSDLAKRSVTWIGINNMMLVPAAVLLVCLVIVRYVDATESARNEDQRKQAEAPPGGKGGIEMLFSDRYLLLIAAIIFTLNLINTNGEYVLDTTLTDVTASMSKAEANEYIGVFKGGYFFWANFAGVILQLFLASRVFKYLGVRKALFIYPVLALMSYTTMTFLPVLAVVQIGKISENSLDYSIYNAVKQALWLPTTREEKYVAKQAVDTFFVRAGDLASAGFVFVGEHVISATTRHFTVLNVILSIVWIGIVVAIGRHYAARAAAKETADAKAKTAEAAA